jgi:hypothetical protein
MSEKNITNDKDKFLIGNLLWYIRALALTRNEPEILEKAIYICRLQDVDAKEILKEILEEDQ